MIPCDFLVVGAGIAGASAAYELASHGKVIVLERESQPGYHTTGRSAAVFHETYGKPLVRRLASASHAFLLDPPENFGEHPLLKKRGVLMPARPDQVERLAEAHGRGASEAGPRLDWLDTAQVLELVPVLRPEYAAAGIYEPEACDLDVHGLHQGFLRGFRARGGRVWCDAEVTRADYARGLWRVQTSQGLFGAPIMIDAAGAWADEVAATAGLPPIGLQPLRRTLMTIEAQTGLDFNHWPFVLELDEAFYFKPDAGRILLSPADETPRPPSDVQPDEYDVALAVDRLQQATTLVVGRVLRRWAGLRSFLPDRLPAVGFDPLADGFFWLAGQGGTGIMTSPAIGRLVAALATGGSLDPELAATGAAEALDPERLRTEYADPPDAT